MNHLPKALLAAAAACFLTGAAPQHSPVAGVDPLDARVDDSGARRFAELWRLSGGQPTAAQLQSGYLARSSHAIEVFTPDRIVSAEHLAATISSSPAMYRDAVERCLPWVEGTNAQLRSAYLGLRGLFPLKPLPQIAVVIGANNSGGTAAPGIQVIGLEVICRQSPTRARFEETMRQFFAHETVHTFQSAPSPLAIKDTLLASALREGIADYVAQLITAANPDQERADWAIANEAMLWRAFNRDREIVRAGTNEKGDMNRKAQAAFRRWLYNAGDAPAGWPGDLGYWMGMRIAERYVARATDPHAAIEDLLNPADPAAILRRSGCGSDRLRASESTP